MKTITLIIFFSLSSSLVFATTGSISGTIIDKKTGKALPGVKVVLEDTKYGAVTDLNGSYLIKNIQTGIYNICAYYEGVPNV